MILRLLPRSRTTLHCRPARVSGWTSWCRHRPSLSLRVAASPYTAGPTERRVSAALSSSATTAASQTHTLALFISISSCWHSHLPPMLTAHAVRRALMIHSPTHPLPPPTLAQRRARAARRRSSSALRRRQAAAAAAGTRRDRHRGRWAVVTWRRWCLWRSMPLMLWWRPPPLCAGGPSKSLITYPPKTTKRHL